jgi:hypothetical protein
MGIGPSVHAALDFRCNLKQCFDIRGWVVSVGNFKIYEKAFPNYNHIVHLCKSNQSVNILGGEHIIYIMIMLTGKSIWFQSFLIYTNLLKHLTMQQYCIKEFWNILLFSECMCILYETGGQIRVQLSIQIPMWTNRNGKNITVHHV